MNTGIYPPVTPTASPHPMLWAAVGVLSAATLALGGTLVYQNQAKVAEPAVVAALAAPTPQPAPSVLVPPAPTVPLEEVVESKPKEPPARINKAPAAPKKIVVNHPRPPVVQQAVNSPPPAREWDMTPPPAPLPPPPPRVVCYDCGVVQSVRPVQREAAASGAGAVAGALLGGLLGNQFGGGQGKTVATMVGVLGGSVAGNTVEKRMKSQTVYQVTARMEDGSTRTVEQTNPLALGDRVTVQGNTMRPDEGFDRNPN